MFVFKKPPKFVRRKLFKSSPANDDIVAKLNMLLEEEGPQIVRWLCRIRDKEVAAITYRELREGALNGYSNLIQDWQADYADFVENTLKPTLLKAMAEGAGNCKYIKFNSTDTDVRDWIEQHTGALITNINQETRKAVQTLVMQGQAAGYSAEQIGQTIRPTVGLTQRQAVANMRYQMNIYETLLEAHPKMKPEAAMKKAEEAALKYAGKQHRYRAEVIANTELAYAYNRGYHENMRQAVKAGLIGNVTKEWSTAYDERTCPTCNSLNGKTVGFDDSFADLVTKATDAGYKGVTVVPPAHPNCRCTVMYRETVLQNSRQNQFTNNDKNGKIDVEIDEKTPCLRRLSDNVIVKTRVYDATDKDLDSLKNWQFDWKAVKSKGYKIYKLMAEDDERIQGLVALSIEPQNNAVYIADIESAPFNNSYNKKVKGKEYNGVGAHLFAIACLISIKNGFNGFTYFKAKTKLVGYYQKKMFAELLTSNGIMCLNELAARKLVGIYYGNPD